MELREQHRSPMIRGIMVLVGTISVGLGILGIFLPVLPTTPFLLLAAACYARSSSRFYQWLLTNRWAGEYIRNYRERRGMPVAAKIGLIALLWLTLGISVGMVDHQGMHVLLALVALGVPVLVLSVPTLRDK